MSRVETVRIGIIVEREAVASPWASHRWRVVGVLLDPPDHHGTWQPMPAPAGGPERFHAASLDVELHHKETGAYRENLIGGDPSVYVVLRHEADGAGNPVTPHLATLSPDEAQAYGALDLESVERVAMPEALRPRLQAYVAAHHVEEAFVKRRRSGVKADDEEIFGQEPIFARRQRRGASSDSDGSAT